MEPSKTYHVYTHANGFENLFRSEENYRYFLQRYQHFIPKVAHTLAYCLMPNHVHFLIQIKSEEEILKAYLQTSQTSEVLFAAFGDLGGLRGLSPVEKRISKQFSNLFNSYTKSFNKMYGRMGSLFIPNFKRKEINNESYLTNIICYIHNNPVHHGFVSTLHDWRWSSYKDILQGNQPLIQREAVLSWFGTTNAFQQAHQQPIPLLDEDRIET